MSDQPDPIDATVFAALVDMTGGEMDFVDELVDTFLGDGDGQIGALQAAVAAGDVESLIRPAHSLKSGSLNVGAMHLGGLCRELEEAARSTDAVADAEDRVSEISSAFAEVRRELLAERARRTSG
jgi:HPt (histidine-containing phosphotransfer) domain-containing protein